MTPLPTRTLGTSGIEVSRIALGSWRTYERLAREDAGAVFGHAIARGVTFFDNARGRRRDRPRADPDRVLRAAVRRAVSCDGCRSRRRGGGRQDSTYEGPCRDLGAKQLFLFRPDINPWALCGRIIRRTGANHL